ncbi:MAG: hypothetical protein KGL39_55680 [Patescibacteria group bacterium]|nr:hypothetical protein [Patescibacteria group bacterium]
MSSPIIDERLMTQCFEPLTGDNDNASRLTTGAALLLVDAFDRHMTRDQFRATVTSAVNLIDAVGSIRAILGTKRAMEDNGGVTMADIEVTLVRLMGDIKLQAGACARVAELLVQCPNDEDKVH